MDRDERAKLAELVKSELAAIEAADTPENEARIIKMAADKGIKITRLRKKNASRYKMTAGKGSVEPLTLLDIEKFLKREITT